MFSKLTETETTIVLIVAIVCAFLLAGRVIGLFERDTSSSGDGNGEAGKDTADA